MQSYIRRILIIPYSNALGVCYASIHSSEKFVSKAIQCIFLGYPYLQKGFKLLRLDNHSILVSKYVRFLEHIFPYHHMLVNIVSSTSFTPENSYHFLDWLINIGETSSSAPCSPILLDYTLISKGNGTVPFHLVL